MDGALYVLLARKLRHQFSHVFTRNPTLHPHVMPKWRCRTVRNVERIERLAKVLVENKLSLFSNVLPHAAVVTSQTPYKQLTCPHHVIQLNTAAYSHQWGPIASTSSGKDRTWNKISYNLILMLKVPSSEGISLRVRSISVSEHSTGTQNFWVRS